jgi:hypothetical protein
MLTPKDAEVGRRVKWIEPVTGQTRFGVIVEVLDNVEVIIDYDDNSKGIAFINNELSNVHPA